MWRDALFGCFLALMWSGVAPAQEAFREWGHFQEVEVPEPGIYRIKLSVEGLSVAQQSLADLRLLDPSGEEVPFLLDRPLPKPAKEVPLLPFHVTMERDRTVATGEVPPHHAGQRFGAIRLFCTPGIYLKSVTVEASHDGEEWVTLLRNRPIYSQPGQPPNDRLEIPQGDYRFWRMTLDDAKSPPVSVGMASVYTAEEEMPRRDEIPADILEITPDIRQTDIRLLLPASNLPADSVRIETDTPAFARGVRLLCRVFKEEWIKEETVASGTIHRIRTEGERVHEQLGFRVTRPISSREIILRITDEDSAPLSVKRVSVEVLPTYVHFYAQKPGTHRLLLGNAKAPSRLYDVAGLKEQFSRAKSFFVNVGPLRQNPDASHERHRQSIEGEGIPLDGSAWSYRRRVLVTASGVQCLDLDPETLAHDDSRIYDLRLIRDGRQVPYLRDLTGLRRHLSPRVETKHELPRTSRWVLTSPYGPLPFTHVGCTTDAPIFQREVRVLAHFRGSRGEALPTQILRTHWSRGPGQRIGEPILQLPGSIQTDRLVLELDNGDNPPLQLEGFRCYYTGAKLIFRAAAGDEIFLYYGKPDATAPQYDLRLVGPELAAAELRIATLSAKEAVKPKSWGAISLPSGSWNYVFWGVMGLVVLALLGVIRKLLPSQAEDPKRDGGGAPPPADA
jgi:hypothetical protein